MLWQLLQISAFSEFILNTSLIQKISYFDFFSLSNSVQLEECYKQNLVTLMAAYVQWLEKKILRWLTSHSNQAENLLDFFLHLYKKLLAWYSPFNKNMNIVEYV